MTNAPERNHPFRSSHLRLVDVEATIHRIVEKMRSDVHKNLGRRGAVVGVSGGIDSSVCVALAVRAFGPNNVLALMLPERESSPESLTLATNLVAQLGCPSCVEDITPALEGFGCYRRRDEAVRRVIPNYDPSTHTMKIGIRARSTDSSLPPTFSVTVVERGSLPGEEVTQLLPLREYLEIVAASNFKQRARMSMLYYHAERLHYAVLGTPNKQETDQGFFVKYGDGGADLMPIGHLYKSQVYQLAEALSIPGDIVSRPPTTDTYPASQTQEEFFYQLPWELVDVLWSGYEGLYPASEVATEVGLSEEEVQRVFLNFDRRRKTTEYLRQPPITTAKGSSEGCR